MSRGELSVERYAAALLGRCAEARNLNAFITLEPEQVLADARACDLLRIRGKRALGSLFGLPLPVKDSINTQDYPTTAGTPALRHFRPAKDAPVIAALRAAGAFVLGKTNLHELSYGWTSDNRAFGAVRNPYDSRRIPGGSSGGTAAAVAAGFAPLGLAEDTEGSIRVPAALCGIAGFRPTTGRYSTEGCVPISHHFDQVGPQARSVLDLALFDSVITGASASRSATPLAGVRLGLVRTYWYTGLDPEVERLTSLALERLAAAGAVLVDTELPELPGLIAGTTRQIQNHDVSAALARYLDAFGAGLTVDTLIARASPDIQNLFAAEVFADRMTETEYAQACGRDLPALRDLFAAYFARTGVAAIVFPATRVPAPLIGADRWV